jgi:16S rRNA (uracil1498-N3)-methyltransferase
MVAPRFHIDQPLSPGLSCALPPGSARHVQVLRLQPGAPITLFNGEGGEWGARVTSIGRSTVQVEIGEHHAVERELRLPVTLAIGMPANERMDSFVEKAAELGVAAIQPLLTERSVLRLAGERALRRQEHWQAIAVAACEQCGRTRVPRVLAVQSLAAWLGELASPKSARWVLSLGDNTRPIAEQALPQDELLILSGPEGGLSSHEIDAARDAGFAAIGLGPRVLRADTAPLAALGYVALGAR